jgi:hypothetical protein
MLTWKAIYKEGEPLSQFNADGSENLYRDIDRKKLSRFELYDGETLKFALFLHEGQRLIFRRRNFISYSKDGEKRWIVYLVGYQFNDETGKNYKVINYVHENGIVELDDDRKDLVILPEEE